MKKTVFVLALIALSLTSNTAQNCSKRANSNINTAASVEKSTNTVVAVEKSTDTVIAVEKPTNTVVAVEKSVSNNTKNEAQAVAVEIPKTPLQNAPQMVDNKAVTPSKPAKMLAFDHSAWNDLLKKHVSSTGKVNYKTFKADVELLDAYMRSLNESAPTEAASKEERLAYWINAYNAVTVRLIITNYPVSSITKLDGGKTWDVKRYTNGGKKLSLNDIENNILRPMGDARIHFALNCAAKSCPPLLNEAFTSENVNKLLEQRTRQFINSSRTVVEKKEIKVPKIFDWYGKDFGNVVDFVNKYAKIKANKTAKVTFSEYDWSLND